MTSSDPPSPVDLLSKADDAAPGVRMIRRIGRITGACKDRPYKVTLKELTVLEDEITFTVPPGSTVIVARDRGWRSYSIPYGGTLEGPMAFRLVQGDVAVMESSAAEDARKEKLDMITAGSVLLCLILFPVFGSAIDVLIPSTTTWSSAFAGAVFALSGATLFRLVARRAVSPAIPQPLETRDILIRPSREALDLVDDMRRERERI